MMPFGGMAFRSATVTYRKTFVLVALLAFCCPAAKAVGETAANATSAATTTNIVHFEEPTVCKVDCLDPHPACEESQKVIETLKMIYEAYGRNDLAAVAPYIDDDCTTFEQNTKTLVVGKKAVLADVQKRINEYRDDKESPILSYTIKSPWAEVKGDTAVVTFVGVKKFGGKHPQTFESHCTDVFKKKDGKWLKMHFVANWKPVAQS
jgi:ketosteroid isomerase-like protein